MSPSERGNVLRFLQDVTEAYDRIDPVAGLSDDGVGRGDTALGQRDDATGTTSTRPW